MLLFDFSSGFPLLCLIGTELFRVVLLPPPLKLLQLRENSREGVLIILSGNFVFPLHISHSLLILISRGDDLVDSFSVLWSESQFL